jgi:hypothetical protein
MSWNDVQVRSSLLRSGTHPQHQRLGRKLQSDEGTMKKEPTYRIHHPGKKVDANINM